MNEQQAKDIQVGQERLAMMLCALGRGVGGPELARILLSVWRSEAVDLSAGGEEEPAKGAPQPYAEWRAREYTAKKPDETAKRLAEINGALAALEVARGHFGALEEMETGVAKAHCQGHRENLRLIQVRLREMAGKEDF